MPALKALLIGGVLLILIAAGTFFFFPSLRPEFVEGWFRSARGFGPAKTPSEAVDKFKDAIKQRDYRTAATYCTREYAEQMVKAAKGAKNVGDEIDNITSVVENTSTKLDDNSKYALSMLEPFPALKILKVHYKEGESTATADVTDESGRAFSGDARYETWRVDQRILRSLTWGVRSPVSLKREGEGDKAVWKLDLPVTSALRECVDYLKENHDSYARALRKVKNEIKNDAASKSDIRERLKSELEEISRK
jgi:hypothetical protein